MFRLIPPAGTPISLKDLFSSYFSFASSPIEEKMREYFGESKVFFTSSGRGAFFLILKALKILFPNRDRVILPAYTCPVLAEVVKECGLKILLCDLEEDSLFMRKEHLLSLVDSRLLCVVPVHLFGYPHPLPEGDFPIVEDCAQAWGAEIKGKKVGTLGVAGFFSLGKGKNLTTDGGGMIVTQDTRLGEILTSLLNPLPPPPSFSLSLSFLTLLLYSYLIHPPGWKFFTLFPLPQEESSVFKGKIYRLSTFKMRLLEKNLFFLEKINRERESNSKRWEKFLSTFSFVKILKPPPESKPVYLRLPVLVEERVREKLYQALLRTGWGVTYMYRLPLSHYPQVDFLNKNHKFPHAENLSRRLITLPTWGYKWEREEEKLEKIFKKFSP